MRLGSWRAFLWPGEDGMKQYCCGARAIQMTCLLGVVLAGCWDAPLNMNSSNGGGRLSLLYLLDL